MPRSLAVIYDEKDRQRLLALIKLAPIGTRIDIKGPKRTLSQNDRFWAMLTDIVKQGKSVINGWQLTTDELKMVFLQAVGIEQQALPTLDGKNFFSAGLSSSSLSKEEFSALIEFMFAWGAENNVVWSDPNLRSQEEMIR